MVSSPRKCVESRLFNTVLGAIIGALLTACFSIFLATRVFVPNLVVKENKIAEPSILFSDDSKYLTNINFTIKNDGMVRADMVKIEFSISGGKAHQVSMSEEIDWKWGQSTSGAEGLEKFHIFATIPPKRSLEGTITIISYQDYTPSMSSPIKIRIK